MQPETQSPLAQLATPVGRIIIKVTMIVFPVILIIIRGNPVQSQGIIIIMCGNFLGVNQGLIYNYLMYMLIILYLFFAEYLQMSKWFVKLLTTPFNLFNTPYYDAFGMRRVKLTIPLHTSDASLVSLHSKS